MNIDQGTGCFKTGRGWW